MIIIKQGWNTYLNGSSFSILPNKVDTTDAFLQLKSLTFWKVIAKLYGLFVEKKWRTEKFQCIWCGQAYMLQNNLASSQIFFVKELVWVMCKVPRLWWFGNVSYVLSVTICSMYVVGPFLIYWQLNLGSWFFFTCLQKNS